MRDKLNTKVLLQGLLCGTLLIAATSDARATESIKVYAGYGGIAGYQLPLWINKEVGISKKYNIDIEPLLIGGGALNMQALLAGNIQLSQNSASSAIKRRCARAPSCDREAGKPHAVVRWLRAPYQDAGQLIG